VLINAVISRLKSGSIRNIIAFSDYDEPPPVPYVVVKSESGIVENTQQVRIMVHNSKGRMDEIRHYTIIELEQLLGDYVYDDEGNRYKLTKSGFTDITPERDDQTYFMERIYLSPTPGIY